MISRRGLLVGSATLAGSFALPADVYALGRVPITGKLDLRMPFPTSRIDPHDLHDPLAAVFATAVADTVYARDARGRVHPTLADGMPRVEDGQTVVTLRPGLRSARGRAMGGRDLAWSVARARKRGAAAFFAKVTPWVRSDPENPLVARFGEIDPKTLAMWLTSPLTSILPVGYDPAAPDGTGPFLARPAAGALELVRNPHAARGPSQLEQVRVRRAVDLADSLRAFESGADDIGWQGMGFYGKRAKARPFNYRDVGWVVLVTGTGAGSLHTPGMAQKLANAVPIESMHVGLSIRPGVSGGTPWSGGSAALLFDSSMPQLKEIADVVAAKMSGSGGTITPRPVSRGLLRRRRASGGFTLALDVVRYPGALPAGTLLALATAESPARGQAVALKLPKRRSGPAHTLTRTLHLGVLGGLSVRGGVSQPVLLAPDKSGRGIDWGSSYRH